VRADGRLDRQPGLVPEQRDHSGHAAADALADGAPGIGQVTKDLEGDRKVVRHENPDGVDVRVRMAPADPGRRQSDDGPELRRARDPSELFDARVVAPLVHHEQAPIAGRGQPPRIVQVRSHRLLDEHRHTEIQQGFNRLRVGDRRRRYDHARDLRKLVDRRDDRRRPAVRGARPRLVAAGHDGYPAVQRVQVAEDVAAPVAAANECDVGRHIGGQYRRVRVSVWISRQRDRFWWCCATWRWAGCRACTSTSAAA
jgi:hypothetical protein